MVFVGTPYPSHPYPVPGWRDRQGVVFAYYFAPVFSAAKRTIFFFLSLPTSLTRSCLDGGVLLIGDGCGVVGLVDGKTGTT